MAKSFFVLVAFIVKVIRWLTDMPGFQSNQPWSGDGAFDDRLN
jgi:hypothetical protein